MLQDDASLEAPCHHESHKDKATAADEAVCPLVENLVLLGPPQSVTRIGGRQPVMCSCFYIEEFMLEECPEALL